MTLIEIASLFEAQKVSVIETSGLAKDALHIYFGLALFLAVRLVWRWRGGWLVAWLAVLAMACGGEWLDHIGFVTADEHDFGFLFEGGYQCLRMRANLVGQ